MTAEWRIAGMKDLPAGIHDKLAEVLRDVLTGEVGHLTHDYLVHVLTPALLPMVRDLCDEARADELRSTADLLDGMSPLRAEVFGPSVMRSRADELTKR